MMRDNVLTPEIISALEEIDRNVDAGVALVKDRIDKLTLDINLGVIELQHTVKHMGVIAIYNAGRVTWDAKLLDGYAAAHPEIAAFRKVRPAFCYSAL